jgi:hypothetical protein
MTRRHPERTEQAEIVKLLRQQAKPSKYRNVKTMVDGIVFDSAKEARRWQELTLLQRAREIQSLGRQKSFALDVNGIPIARYVVDFVYYDKRKGDWVHEDVKGMRTREFIIKSRLMKALYDIDILET